MQNAFAGHAHVGEIRHIGLIHAIELVADRQTKAAFPAEKRLGYEIYKRALQHGLLLRPLGDVLYFNPALNITQDELAEALRRAQLAISEVLPG